MAFNIDTQCFGNTQTGSDEEKREKFRHEGMVLVGFASFLVTVPRRSKQAHNSTAHAQRSKGVVRSYYEHMNGRVPGAGLGVYFTRKLKGVTR